MHELRACVAASLLAFGLKQRACPRSIQNREQARGYAGACYVCDPYQIDAQRHRVALRRCLRALQRRP